MRSYRMLLRFMFLFAGLSPCLPAAPGADDPATDDGAAATSQPAPPPSVWERLATTDRLTGDWGGARTALEDRGVDIALGLTSIYQHNARGGARTLHRVSGSYDLELTLDLGKLGLLDGGTVYALADGSWDDGISDAGYVGDLFGVNGDAGGNLPINLTELWYEQALLDEKLRIRFGKLDLSVDFDTNAYANDETAQFLNNALISTGNIPLPDTGHGIQFVATPCEWFYFGAGVADADAVGTQTGFRTAYHGPAHTFSIYEFGLTPTWDTPLGKLPGNYRFGLWYDPQPKERFFNDLDGRRRTIPLETDDLGFYVNFDQLVLQENPQVEGDEQGLGLFFRYGYANGNVNEIDNFWSVGGQYRGLIPRRDDDVLAFGVAQGQLSEQLRLADMDPRRETVLECYYNIQLLPWLNLSPDFQWILRPGGEDGRDAFVAGLRLQAAF